MTRALYRSLVWMHPPAFRREFAGEMLWIFDEAAQSEGAGRLLIDGFASLARQWLLRTGCWKIAAALLAALLQMSFGGILMVSLRRHPAAWPQTSTDNPELAAIMRLGALTAVVLLAAVISLVFWWRGLARRTGA